MKTSRVITLVLVAVTTLLCCFPVAALDVANSYSYSNVIDNNLTQYLNVSVMYADDESYAYGTDSDVVQYYDAPTYQALVNYRVKNTSDQDANLNVSFISLDFGLQASGYNVIGVEYVSGGLEPYYVSISDFRLQQVDGTSTTVIVPGGGYISGTFIIHLQDTYDNSSGTHIQYPAFSNFNTWDTFSPTYGNFNSTVLDYVADEYVELLEQGISIDNIVDLLSFEPSYFDTFSIPHNSSVTSTVSGTKDIYENGSVVAIGNAYSRLGNPCIVSKDSSYYSSFSEFEYIIKVPRYEYISLYNTTSRNLSFSSRYFNVYFYAQPRVTGFVPLGSDFYVLDCDGFAVYFNSGDSKSFISTDKYNLELIPYQNRYYSCITYYYFGYNGDSVPSSLNITYSGSCAVQYNGSVTSYDNEIDQSIDQAHQQEQSYYDSTNSALENSGLPDYNFNSQQTGGLSGVSDDFVRVWNACGALNSVFVFSLTLSLALYILRHRRRL